MSTELQRAAKKYAEKGLAIFPLAMRGKIPLTKNGVKDATSDPAVIVGWWEQWPDANIGLATGSANGIVVIDLDIDEEKNLNGYDSLKAWQKEHGCFPHTLYSKTGRGGYHMIYKTDESYKNRVGIIPGVDIRADGGYIVAPPSIHPNGNPYRWAIDPEMTGIAEADDIVKIFLETGSKKQTDAKQIALPEKVTEGCRNDTMFRIACSLQAKGLSDEAIFAACRKENEKRFVPPLENGEMEAVISSCLKRFTKGAPISFDAAGKAVQAKHKPVMICDSRGDILQTIANAVEAIEYDEKLYGKIRYNELSYSPYLVGAVPWEPDETNFREWTDFDDSALKSYIESRYKLRSGQKCMDALNVVLQNNRFNPVKEKLTEIHDAIWDGQTGHVRKLLPAYLGVEDSEYSCEAMRIFMLGAVARAFEPGCKFDYMLVLVGEQGVGKSAFLRALSIDGRWFNDNFNTIEGDKASEKLRGMWIVEMAELLAAKKHKDKEAIKAFTTSTVDTYRAPYGRRTEQRPRSCVFAGSTNTMFFLSDPTGGRRFLPINTSKENRTKDVMRDEKELEQEILQAWGEIMDIFLKADMKPKLKLSEEMEQIALSMQERHTEEDPRIGMIQDWLDRTRPRMVCAAQLYMEALEHDRYDWTKGEINDIHQIMMNDITGWVRMKKKGRCGRYGVQIAYAPDPKAEKRSEEELPF